MEKEKIQKIDWEEQERILDEGKQLTVTTEEFAEHLKTDVKESNPGLFYSITLYCFLREIGEPEKEWEVIVEAVSKLTSSDVRSQSIYFDESVSPFFVKYFGGLLERNPAMYLSIVIMLRLDGTGTPRDKWWWIVEGISRLTMENQDQYEEEWANCITEFKQGLAALGGTI